MVNTQMPCWDLAGRVHFLVRFCSRNFECYCKSGLICGGPKSSQIKLIVTAQAKPLSVLPCQKHGVLNNCRLPAS